MAARRGAALLASTSGHFPAGRAKAAGLRVEFRFLVPRAGRRLTAGLWNCSRLKSRVLRASALTLSTLSYRWPAFALKFLGLATWDHTSAIHDVVKIVFAIWLAVWAFTPLSASPLCMRSASRRADEHMVAHRVVVNSFNMFTARHLYRIRSGRIICHTG